MRNYLIWLGALFSLALLNWAIFEREQVREHGETVYLKLAPVDPRSLMQGDYMALRYDIARQVDRDQLDPVSGRLIMQLDAQNIASFSRVDDGRDLDANERYLRYKNRHGARFGLESFFFQEGQAERYADAEYAEIKLTSDGSALLVDLVNLP